MKAGGHKPRDVSHIHHKHRPRLVGDLPEFLKINGSGIGRRPRNDHFRAAFQRGFPQLIIIDKSLVVHPIGHDLKIFSGNIHRASVGEMSAVIQIHPHDGVPGVADRKLHRQIGLCPRMGLYVGIIAAKELLRPLNGQLLHHIHALASAVVTLRRVSFRILVGQRAAHGRHHRFAHPVLGSDQLDMAVLSLLLIHDGLGDFRVNGSYFFK